MKRSRFSEEQIIGILKEHQDQGLQSTTRLRAGRDRSACVSARVEASSRHGTAHKDERTGL